MNMMKHEIKEVDSRQAEHTDKSGASSISINKLTIRSEQEVLMKRWFTAIAVSVVLASSVAGLALAKSSRSVQSVGDQGGLMPEVVVVAKGPQLVMPTVEVSAERGVAAIDGPVDVY
jgi:hypothetical protein